MPNMKPQSFTVQKVWPKLKSFFFPINSHRDTGKKLDAPEFKIGT